MWCMELKIGMSDKHHRYSKNTKFRQNLRGGGGPYNSSVIGHGMTQRGHDLFQRGHDLFDMRIKKQQ